MRYIIAGTYFDPTSGGQRVLAHLCHALNDMGQHAAMPPGYNLDTGYDRGLCLPSAVQMSKDDVATVCQALKEVVGERVAAGGQQESRECA